MRTKPTYRTSKALTGPTLCRSSLPARLLHREIAIDHSRDLPGHLRLGPSDASRWRWQKDGYYERASDTGMDDQLQGIVDTIAELAWSAGPDGAADFFNQRRLPSLRHS
jgi:hypothetical protein